MMEKFIPSRARDTTEDEIVELLKSGPLLAFNKYDGVRCCVQNSIVYGKSLLPHRNRYIQNLYGKECYNSLEFEITVKDNGMYNPITSVRETVSFINSFDSVIDHNCYLIDTVPHEEPYKVRLERLKEIALTNANFLIPEYEEFSTLQQLLNFENRLLSLDNEGLIIRNQNLKYVYGKSSKQGEILRLKRYISEEGIIIGFTTIRKNNNISVRNSLGLLEKSSHKHNLVATEDIATFRIKMVKDVVDPWSKRLLFHRGQEATISAITIPVEERASVYHNRNNLIGKMIKFKSFPKGTKDKPRFAVFESFVADSDFPL